MLELYYNFYNKFCKVNKFEKLEMDTDSLYLALAEKKLEECIRPEMKAEWEHLRWKDCTDSFNADPVEFFSPNVLWQAQKTWQEKAWSFQRGVQVFGNAVSS